MIHVVFKPHEHVDFKWVIRVTFVEYLLHWVIDRSLHLGAGSLKTNNSVISRICIVVYILGYIFVLQQLSLAQSYWSLHSLVISLRLGFWRNIRSVSRISVSFFILETDRKFLRLKFEHVKVEILTEVQVKRDNLVEIRIPKKFSVSF
jgi:hypothetical protein